MSKIKTLITYIVYPFTLAHYFKKALEHRDDIDLRIAGPYTGSWQAWMNGMTLPEKYNLPPDVPLPFPPNIGEINYELVKAQLGDWVPDLIIQFDAGLHFKYKPTDGLTVTVGTDPHVLNDWYDTPRKYGKFFNMQEVYSKPGDIYLPYAYSRYDHYLEEQVVKWDDFRDVKETLPIGGMYPKDTDCVLIGMPYEQRTQWVNALRSRGLSVIFENGPIFDEARVLYNRGRVGLNWSSLDDLNARAFELPAMKLYPVMNRVTDMKNFPTIFDNCGIFENNLPDAIEKVMWAKGHQEEAQRLAEAAYEAVLPETYDARVQMILNECGFA